MQKYFCLRCGKVFTHHPNMFRHFKRKNPCSVLYMDVTCNEMLTNYNLLREEYRIKFISKRNNPTDDVKKLIEENNILKEENDKLKLEIECLKNKLNGVKINNESLYEKAYLNDFGKEDISDIDFEYIIDRRFMAVPFLIERLYYDIPQNRNVYIKMKDKYSYIRQDNKWTYMEKKNVVEEMIYYAMKYINDYINNNKSNLDANIINIVRSRMEKQMYDEDTRDDCYKNVLDIVLKKQSIVKEYYKEMYGTNIRVN